jgi:hypothetical protein
MAIKGGDLIHVGNQILIDRAQTAGPGQVNITTEKVYELGNYKSIGQVRQTPEVTFDLESFDASAEFESMLVGKDFVTMADGTAIEPAKALPIDVASSFKAGFSATNPFDVVGSVAIPYLTLESLSYRFGIADNASQSASLRGDGVYYSPSSTYIEETAGSGTAGQVVTLKNPALLYSGDTVAGDRYTISVSTASGKRLTFGAEFTENVTGTGTSRTVTVTLADAVPTTDKVRVLYASPTVAVYPQESHEPTKDNPTRPAAIRGRDIEVYVGGEALGDRWTSVQSANVDYRVTLDRDEELGNPQIVSQDFDVPAVSGALEIKPRDYRDLYQKIARISDVPAGEVAGPLSSKPLSLVILLHAPDTGDILKTLYVPDARFTMPGYSGRVQTKTTVTMNWESDEGTLVVYKGPKPANAPAPGPAPAPVGP